MKRRALGLDISGDFIAAVVVQQMGHERQVTACAFHELSGGEDLADLLPGLLARIGWSAGTVACGIPLAGVSIRNQLSKITRSHWLRLQEHGVDWREEETYEHKDVDCWPYVSVVLRGGLRGLPLRSRLHH